MAVAIDFLTDLVSCLRDDDDAVSDAATNDADDLEDPPMDLELVVVPFPKKASSVSGWYCVVLVSDYFCCARGWQQMQHWWHWLWPTWQSRGLLTRPSRHTLLCRCWAIVCHWWEWCSWSLRG